jgi:hypothetical protein
VGPNTIHVSFPSILCSQLRTLHFVQQFRLNTSYGRSSKKNSIETRCWVDVPAKSSFESMTGLSLRNQ